MIEIAPGVRAGIMRKTATGAVYFQIEIADHPCYLDEQQMDRLQGVLQNAIQAAVKVRLGQERKGQRWVGRAR